MRVLTMPTLASPTILCRRAFGKGSVGSGEASSSVNNGLVVGFEAGVSGGETAGGGSGRSGSSTPSLGWGGCRAAAAASTAAAGSELCGGSLGGWSCDTRDTTIDDDGLGTADADADADADGDADVCEDAELDALSLSDPVRVEALPAE